MTLVNRLTIKSIAHSKDDMDIFLFIGSGKNRYANRRNSNKIFDHI